MEYFQHLPTYRHDFEKDPRFLSCQSLHYLFYYFSDSEAERDIHLIIQTQESAYAKIIDFLKTKKPNRLIEYFFYPDKKTKIKLMGDNWYAQSIYNEFRIHVLYTHSIKPIGPHEDTHLLSLPWGLSIGFFQEGLAEYMVGHAWDRRPHVYYVREGYQKKIYPPLIEFMQHETWLKIDDAQALYYYSLAGVFISFLIQRYGKALFKYFYKKSGREKSRDENQRIFHEVYGLKITEVEQIFINNYYDESKC